MKTPKIYQDNIKNRIITKQMLLDCLYSSNKRAKNWRDKEREVRQETKYRQSSARKCVSVLLTHVRRPMANGIAM